MKVFVEDHHGLIVKTGGFKTNYGKQIKKEIIGTCEKVLN